jgi:predicted phage terminase large subunit-like protein
MKLLTLLEDIEKRLETYVKPPLKKLLYYSNVIANFKGYENDNIQLRLSSISELLIENLEKIEVSEKNLNIISLIYKNLQGLLSLEEDSNIIEYELIQHNPILKTIWNKYPKDRTKERFKNELLKSYDIFTKFVIYELENNYIDSPFSKIFSDRMQDIFNGDIKRLIINIPMGYGKTLRGTIIGSLYGFALEPASRFIHVSYSQTLAFLNSDSIKNFILENRVYKTLFDIKIVNNSKSKGLWLTQQGGYYRASSSGSAITGFRAGNLNIKGFSGCIFIDDPLKPDDALSDVKRTFINNRYENTFKSRLANEDIPVVVIMQRLHPEDFSNHLITRYPNEWHLLKIPALFEGVKETKGAININVNKYNSFELNRSTWERKYPTKYLFKEKEVNPLYFFTQLQQEPINTGVGNILNPDWVQKIPIKQLREIEFQRVAMFCDTAMKKGRHNDYTVFNICGIDVNGEFYILEMNKGKYTFTELVKELKKTIYNYEILSEAYNLPRLESINIEDKVSGTSLIQVLESELSFYPVKPIKRVKDKITRASNVAYLMSLGVYVSSHIVYYQDIKKEFKEFSIDDSHPHDDIIDTIVDGIEHLKAPIYKRDFQKVADRLKGYI